MSEQGFRGILGVPDGLEVVAFREANHEEMYLDNHDGSVLRWTQTRSSVAKYVIVRKIEKPKQYRQFKNGEEFKPFRDRWWRMKSESVDCCHPPVFYSDNNDWGRAFDLLVFDDGTPFGVEVAE
jgi:hypothetical protein